VPAHWNSISSGCAWMASTCGWAGSDRSDIRERPEAGSGIGVVACFAGVADLASVFQSGRIKG